jgi:hypothetical protein
MVHTRPQEDITVRISRKLCNSEPNFGTLPRCRPRLATVVLARPDPGPRHAGKPTVNAEISLRDANDIEKAAAHSSASKTIGLIWSNMVQYAQI